MRLRILAGIAVGFALPNVAGAQSSLFLPNGAATAEGPSQNNFPWGRGNGAIRQQCIYDSSHFTAQGVTTPIHILGARWRANATNTTTTWTGTTYSNVEVSLGSAAVDQSLVSQTFATNRGLDFAPVYGGQVTYMGGAGNGLNIPGPNVVDLTFQIPFFYDPSRGNDFLCEVTFPTGAWSGGTLTGHDVFTTASSCSRVFNPTDPAQPTGSLTVNHGVVIELRYVPASGLHAEFESATARSGPAPHTVQFTDRSYSSTLGGVLTWAWDLDGDNIVDSNAQNPSFTYSTCGGYDVSLTVTDSQHPAATRSRTDFIVVEPQFVVDAQFTATPRAGIAPVNATFSDLSTGTPTAWAWDFNGDSIVDSTAQNPTFLYTIPGVYAVTLTASNACFSAIETKTSYIYVIASGVNRPADVLCYQMNEVRGNQVANVATSTTFPALGTVSNTGWQRGPGAGRGRFDANEAGFGCLSYTPTTTPGRNWIDTGRNLQVNGDLTVMWWARRDPASSTGSPFGYFFGDTSSFRCFMGAAGILFSGGTGTSLSSSYGWDFQSHLAQNVWNHYALVIDNANGVNTLYENGIMHLLPRNFTPNSYTYTGTGNLIVGAFNTAGGSPASAHYDLDDFRIYGAALSQADIVAALENEYASSGAFGAGCAGPGGLPVLSASQRPTIPNAAYAVDGSNLEPARPASVIFGTAANLGGVLPLDLSGVLGAGCSLGVLPEISIPIFTAGGSVQLPVPLPVDPLLNGYHGYVQVIVLGSSGAVSNALDVNMQIN